MPRLLPNAGRRTRRFLVLGVIGAVAVAAVLAGRALADTGSGGASYRTAVAKRADVSQTLQRSGTIEPVAQGTVAFPISGTITNVAVQPGQAVSTGQTLATLDTTTLNAALTSKQATLATAQLTLSNALNGISSTPSGSSGSGTRPTTPSTSASNTAAANSAVDSGALQGARQSVVGGQQQVDGALTAAKAALQAASSSCAQQQSSSSPSTTSTSSTTSSTAPSSTTTTAAPSSPTGSNDCVKDLQASLAAQQQVASAQSALAQAESKLDNMLTSATTSGSGRSGGASTGSPSSAAASSGPSSSELVADQAAVDAAQADVTSAEQNLAQATIVSPIDGTVAAVNMAVHDQVSAGSSTENIIVVGPGGYEVTTTVLVTDIGKVKLGDGASVLPDGSSTPIDGKVVNVGVVPTTSGTNTAYPVVIGLTGSPSGLRNGAAGAVTITLSAVSDAITVPTSAVRTVGGGGLHIVTVYSAGKTTIVPVQIGAVGSDLTEIRSGLQAGQTVVLADMHQPLPSASTTNNRGLGGGLGGGGLGGGLGGGGFGGGGFVTRGG